MNAVKMWGESSKNCEINCQCSGLITENFKINSGNSATKRKQETALSNNYKLKMNPHSLDFTSPIHSPIQTKRRILGELQNFNPISPTIERLKNSPLPDLKSPSIVNSLKSPLKSFTKIKSPLNNYKSPSNNYQSPSNNYKSPSNNYKSPHNNLKSPLAFNSLRSPLSTLNNLNSFPGPSNSSVTPKLKRSSKITRIFEERTRFKMSLSNKENLGSLANETFMKLDVEEETRDCSFGDRFQMNRDKVKQWSTSKLDFTDALPSKTFEETQDILVPEKEQDLEDLESLQDLEAEFDNENFDHCTNYEIISTDSPDIISRGRPSSSRKISSRNFDFGAPIAENEQSTSFNRPATRMLNFDDDDFEFTSPAVKKTVSVKKSLKFNMTPTKTLLRHERSDSSIGSMSSSPSSVHLNRVFTSESTTSMESGFISELEEPFLEIDESNSPKIANFNDLLSGTIKDSPLTSENFLKRPALGRSLSFHPEPSRARVSLLSILESPEKRTQKRTERAEEEQNDCKRRKSNVDTTLEKVQRPVLQRAYSENSASIISALARSATEPDLIGDFTQPFALPLTNGDHSDLKSISCDTLAKLLRGEYADTVSDYQVIDCRYPYEFTGGHVLGAVNMYTSAQVAETLAREACSRRVLVFHCEFSLQRGPALTRFLRSADREKNKENYPFLDYPEVYLLHEGYHGFYKKHPDLCTPRGYIAMLDPRHRHLLRKHRSISQPASTMRRNRLLL